MIPQSIPKIPKVKQPQRHPIQLCTSLLVLHANFDQIKNLLKYLFGEIQYLNKCGHPKVSYKHRPHDVIYFSHKKNLNPLPKNTKLHIATVKISLI